MSVKPFKQRKFTIDAVVHQLDKYPFSPIGAVVLTLALFLGQKKINGSHLPFFQYLTHTWWLPAYLAWVFGKTVNRAIVRLIMNHGWMPDKPRWSGRPGEVVVITGGAMGIGAQIVEQLSEKTNKIAVLDLAEPTYNAKNVSFYKCDVTSPSQIAEVATQIRKDLGKPTILINNAGIARGKTLMDLTADEMLLTYKVNTLGAFNILKEFLPHITKINHGHIVTVASSASYMSLPNLGEYACSKSAVLALHEVLREELVHRYNAPKVRTSVFCPTKVMTNLGQTMEAPPSEFFTPTLSPVYVARQIVKTISSGLSDHRVMPLYASILLPAVRSLPEWHRHFINKGGKLHLTVTDKRVASFQKTYINPNDAKQ